MKKYPKYKDSGVSWIGEIPEEWDTIKPKFCGVIRSGNSITKEQMKSSGIEVYGGNGFMGYTDQSNIDVPALIIGRVGALCGNVRLVHEKKWVTDNALILSINNYLYYPFAAYTLTSCNLNSLNTSNAQPLITGTKVMNVQLPLPSASEQRAIVSYLDKKTSQIDRFISEAEKEIDKLNELKQAQIAHMVTHGLNPNVPMKDSGIAWIGQIPEHWEVKRIALLFSENKDKNYDYEFDHALKFNYGTLVPKNEKGDVSELKDTYIAYTKIKRNDIAINCLNLNYDFVSQRVAECPQDGILTSAYLIITPREGVNSQYYNFLFKAMDSKKLFHGMGTGIRLTLSYNELKKQYVVVPPNDEQAAIVSAINSMSEKIDTLTTQIGYLKELKQRIISDAVTGKVMC